MLGKLKKRKRNKTHGFLKRMTSRGGRSVLNARRAKGRHKLAVSARRAKSKR